MATPTRVNTDTAHARDKHLSNPEDCAYTGKITQHVRLRGGQLNHAFNTFAEDIFDRSEPQPAHS